MPRNEEFHVGHSDPLNSVAKIKWHAVVGGKRYPLEKTMQGVGYDATCTTCGWDSGTGGAVKSHVKRKVDDHKFDHEWAAKKATGA